MKFSIIVPIYNVSKYLTKCLDSIIKQTYDNFEVILVNDGSTDDSPEIIDKYVKLDKRFIRIDKKNGGLSSARNEGIKKSSGDYLIFVDSDDYINKYLLHKLNEKLNTKLYDLVRFKVSKIIDDKEIKEDYIDICDLKGSVALTKLIKDPLFVTAWHQAYNANFFKSHKFIYPEGRLHEDFGLTPIVYLTAESVASIDVTGYYYIIRENSIMTSKNEEKEIKRNEDMLYLFNHLIKYASKLQIEDDTLKIFNSFLANSLINRCKDLKGDILKNYLTELKKYHVSSYLLDDTLGRKLKKLTFNIFPKIYITFYLK